MGESRKETSISPSRTLFRGMKKLEELSEEEKKLLEWYVNEVYPCIRKQIDLVVNGCSKVVAFYLPCRDASSA